MPEITHMCPACAAGLLSECENAQVIVSPDGSDSEWIIPCWFRFTGEGGGALMREKRDPGRPMLDPKDVRDAKSTGRKRAAMLAPILTGQTCGWSHLKHAGGGVVPILGCNGNQMIEAKGGDPDAGYMQGDRHHGPDKNTLNNSVGVNLHSICVDCHHRWHALNDPFYSEEGRGAADEPFLPVEGYYLHDSFTSFTDEEYEIAEAWWDLHVEDRPPYPFGPSTAKALPIESKPDTLDPSTNPFIEGDSL